MLPRGHHRKGRARMRLRGFPHAIPRLCDADFPGTVNIAGMDDSDRVRAVAQKTVDELFSLMKPPSSD